MSHDDGPLSGLGYAVAGVLAADVEDDRTDVRLEIIFDDVVSLFPVRGRLIVIVIKDLIEPVLLL